MDDKDIIGRDERAVRSAIELCGGDISLSRRLYAVWRTELLSLVREADLSEWSPISSMSVQRTLIVCGLRVEDNPSLVQAVGEIVKREVEWLQKKS